MKILHFQAVTSKLGRPYTDEEMPHLLNELQKLFDESKLEEVAILSSKELSANEKMKKLQKLQKKNKWSEEQKSNFENINLGKLNSNLAGAEEEEGVFNKLRFALEKLDAKDTIVINGWHIEVPVKDRCEFDFLIISEPLKAIFQIEVKQKCHDSAVQSAMKQLQWGQELFKSKIKFPEEENWKYVKAIYFALNEENKDFKSSEEKADSEFKFCQNCQSYLLGPATDFSDWWEQMNTALSEKESEPKSRNRNIYNKTVQFLTRQMYIQGDCFTNQDLLNYTEEKIEKISTVEKIFFWSKAQYLLMKEERKRRIVFASTFGTGKTILLISKAKQLLERGEKVIFVFFGNPDSYKLLRNTLKEKLGDQAQIWMLKFKGYHFLYLCWYVFQTQLKFFKV